MIVFLDIDGVILPVGALNRIDVQEVFENPDVHFETLVKAHSKEAIAHLKTLLAATDAKLVLHSSWRRFFPHEFTRRYLAALGLAEHFHEDDFCPMRFSSHKPHDIGEWLEDHSDVKEAIVIDDDEFPVYGKCEHGDVKIHRITPISNRGLILADIQPFLGKAVQK